MTVEIFPITENFAAELGDVDLAVPLNAADRAAIETALNRYSVLVFPGQHLSEEQHLDFARNFGPLETSVHAERSGAKLRLRPDLGDISNLAPDGKVWDEQDRRRMYEKGNYLWHTDSSFKRIPAKASLLYAHTIPPIAGQTEYADMRAAYDALDDPMKKRLQGLVAEHAIMNSRARLGFTDFSDEERRAFPPVPQTMVRRHAGSGRMALYIASHAGRIFGMDDEDANSLVQQLIEHASQRQFVYTHRWHVNDLVMWNNRCTMHRGRPYDDLRWPRAMQRATVADVAPTCEQEGIPVPVAA
jgi:alpha-ketoglutarate-dependent 2,4-dichlorophenoxyacetate dioxygenase